MHTSVWYQDKVQAFWLLNGRTRALHNLDIWHKNNLLERDLAGEALADDQFVVPAWYNKIHNRVFGRRLGLQSWWLVERGKVWQKAAEIGSQRHKVIPVRKTASSSQRR